MIKFKFGFELVKEFIVLGDDEEVGCLLNCKGDLGKVDFFI